MQRRLAVVTDEYVVLADYVSSEVVREYDCLIHPLGFKSVEGAKAVGEPRERGSYSEWSPYKYFTNLQWYKGGDNPAKFIFDDRGYGIDVHLVWPQSADIFYAHYPNGGKPSHEGMRNNPDRRTVGVRVNAKEVVFLSIVEPYKGKSKIASVECKGEEQITVTLKCGTVQTLKIAGLKGVAKDVKVTLETTSKDGAVKAEQN